MMELTLPERLANGLRRDILRGKLKPDATLKERDLAEEMDVSRTPMREAIRILAQEGLVMLRPSRSPIVANPSFGELHSDLEVLLSLELLSGKLACERATPSDLSEIRSHHEKLAHDFGKVDMLDSFEIDMRFHRAIVRAAHNDTLSEIHQTLLAKLWRARFLSAVNRRSRARVMREHTAIVEGLENRDATLVQDTLGAHLAVLKETIRVELEREAAEDSAPRKTAGGQG